MIASSAPAVPPAGVARRGVAAVLDVVVFLLVQASLAGLGRRLWGVEVEENPLFHVSVALFTLLFACVYMTVLHAAGGQTLGKLLVGVRVVGVDGEPLTVGAAFLRYLCYAASLVPFGLGYVMAALRRDRRALHDLLAASRVERVAAPQTPADPWCGEVRDAPPASAAGDDPAVMSPTRPVGPETEPRGAPPVV